MDYSEIVPVSERELLAPTIYQPQRNGCMQLIGYGEDSYTMYVLSAEIDILFSKLNDGCGPQNSIVLYRPCFGRKHGIGEFDFIILASNTVYLGETKLIYSGKNYNNIILKQCQIDRHDKMEKLIRLWFELPSNERILLMLEPNRFHLKLPTKNSGLYQHIESFLSLLSSKYSSLPLVKNKLLVLSDVIDGKEFTVNTSDFDITSMRIPDPSVSVLPKYINLR
ncbi:MAG: hypothetical protein PHG06_19630 [Parabacteroides sp.]|nr:hypothetical protein [Parabacteroides sp.]